MDYLQNVVGKTQLRVNFDVFPFIIFYNFLVVHQLQIKDYFVDFFLKSLFPCICFVLHIMISICPHARAMVISSKSLDNEIRMTSSISANLKKHPENPFWTKLYPTLKSGILPPWIIPKTSQFLYNFGPLGCIYHKPGSQPTFKKW